MRFLLALLAGVLGAIVGGAIFSIGLAILFTAIWGSFEGSAAMGGFTVGLPLGALIGFGLGLWLVLRRGGQAARPALLWIGVAALLVVLSIAVVAFG